MVRLYTSLISVVLPQQKYISFVFICEKLDELNTKFSKIFAGTLLM